MSDLGISAEEQEMQMAILQSMGRLNTSNGMEEFNNPQFIEQQRAI
jgi:hypothetical protein